MAISNFKLHSAETSIVGFLVNYLIYFDNQRRVRTMFNMDELKNNSTFCQISWNESLNVIVSDGVKTDKNFKNDDLGVQGEFNVSFDVSSVRDMGVLYTLVTKVYNDFKKKAPSLPMDAKNPLKIKFSHNFGISADVMAIKSVVKSLKNKITWKYIETPSFKTEFSDWYKDVFLPSKNDKSLSEALYKEFVVAFNQGKSFSFKRSSLIDVVCFFNDTKGFGYHVEDGDKITLGNKLVETVLSKFLTGVDENDFSVLDSAVDIIGNDNFTSKVFRSLNADFNAIKKVESFSRPVCDENKLISLNPSFFKKGFEFALKEIMGNELDWDKVNLIEIQKKVLTVITHPYMLNVSGVDKFDLVRIDVQSNLCVLKVNQSFNEANLNSLICDVMEYLSERMIKTSGQVFNPANPFAELNNPQEQENLSSWCKMKELRKNMDIEQYNPQSKENILGFKI